VRYELWDSETGNRVGTYPTERAALAAVAEDIGRYGRDSEAVLALGLLRRDPDDLVVEGRALVDRALGGEPGTAASDLASGHRPPQLASRPSEPEPRANPSAH
jgi:hypothetical protein